VGAWGAAAAAPLRRRVVLGVLAGLGVTAGWAASPGPLLVFAAADLALALQELVPRFEAARGLAVTLVLGSTAQLAHQIAAGAPADVFLAAEEGAVDRLIAQDVLAADTRVLYGEGRLALITARRAGPPLATLEELARPEIRHVALANPAHAPYGRAAEEALRAVGLWEALRPKLVYGDNVRQALQFVQSGAAEAGLVARALADSPGVAWRLVDDRLHRPITQAAAASRRSPRPALARAFLAFLTGAEGRRVLRRYGFRLAGEP
jgi:molybdate transport system substrate-binding protein